MKQLLAILFTVLTIGASAQDTTDTKPSTNDIVNSFMTELLEFSKDAGAFAKEQVPLVLQEYVAWGAAEGITLFVLGAALIIGYVYGCRRWALQAADDGESVAAIYIILGGMASIAASFAVFVGLMQAMKALIAPRVYLIETLSDLIR